MAWQAALLEGVLGREIAPVAGQLPLASAGDVSAVVEALDAAFLVALGAGQRGEPSLMTWLQRAHATAVATARDMLPPLVQRALREAGTTDATGVAYLNAVASAVCAFAVNALTDLAAEAAASSTPPTSPSSTTLAVADTAPPLHRELATLLCTAPNRVRRNGGRQGGRGGGRLLPGGPSTPPPPLPALTAQEFLDGVVAAATRGGGSKVADVVAPLVASLAARLLPPTPFVD
jgi:hypothetical protein